MTEVVQTRVRQANRIRNPFELVIGRVLGIVYHACGIFSNVAFDFEVFFNRCQEYAVHPANFDAANLTGTN